MNETIAFRSDTLSSERSRIAARDHPPLRAAARAEEAERTRQRIIDAVFERLRAAPAEPIAIDRIAAMAGVARSTVYAIFGSRAGLFDAVGAELAARSRLRAASSRPRTSPTPARRCAAASARRARCSPPNRDICRALRSMAQLDQEAVGGVGPAQGGGARRAAMARIAASCTSRACSAPGVSAEEASDVLWVLTSFESFDLLYTGRGLPLDAVVERLTDDRRARADAASGGAACAVRSRFSGTNWFAVNSPPCGSRDGHADPRRVERAGQHLAAELRGALAAMASASSTPKVTPQCAASGPSAIGLSARDDVDEAAGRAHLAHALARARVELLEVVAVAGQRPRGAARPCRATPSRTPRRRTPSRRRGRGCGGR